MVVRVQGQRRLLNPGDEICLVKPRVDADMEPFSFVFTLNDVPQRSQRPLVGSTRGSLRSSPSGSLGLFGGGRRVEDYYDIREEIGRGTSGRVYLGVHRITGESWAIKVSF